MHKAEAGLKKKLLYLFIFAAILLSVLLTPIVVTSTSVFDGHRQCYSSWAEAGVEKMVTEILYKRGGLPPVQSPVFVAGNDIYPAKQEDESVLIWRVNKEGFAGLYNLPDRANLSIELNEPIREPEFDIISVVDVLYADGVWRELEWKRERNGYVSFCFLPPLLAGEFSTPINYKTHDSSENLPVVLENSFAFGDGNSWHYRVYDSPSEDWRVITSQIDGSTSTDALLEFKTYNQKLGKELASIFESLTVQILFEQPLDQSTFDQIVHEHSLSEIIVYVQSTNIDGESVTWPLQFGDGTRSVEQKLQFEIDDAYMPDIESNLSVLGITTAIGKLPSKEYLSLRTHDDISMIDVTPTLVQQQILEQTGSPITQSDLFGVVPLAFIEN